MTSSSVSAGLYAYVLEDETLPPPPVRPPQVFYTRRSRIDLNRPVIDIADEEGDFIGRLVGEPGAVSWRTDGYGRMTLAMPPQEAARRAELIEFGRRALVKWDNGLPPWVGVIDVPRENVPGRTTVNLYSMEYTLGWSLTERNDVYSSEMERNTPDYILSRLLVNAGRGDIAVYTVASDEPAIDISFRYEDLLSAAGRLREQNDRFHWYIAQIGASSIAPGLRMFYGWRRDRRGDARLVEGHNLVNVETVEQGPIFNDVTVAAGNDDPESAGLALVYRFARPGRYGSSRQLFVPLPEVTVTAQRESDLPAERDRVLPAYAYAEYERYYRPVTRYRGMCVNRPPSPFGTYDLGDLVTVELNGYGRRRTELDVLIVGMEFDPLTGMLTVVGEHREGDQTL